MTREPDMVEVAQFATRLEAETIGNALTQHGIPFLIQANDAGGMYMNIAGGAALLVPASCVDDVAQLLNCVVKPPPQDENAS